MDNNFLDLNWQRLNSRNKIFRYEYWVQNNVNIYMNCILLINVGIFQSGTFVKLIIEHTGMFFKKYSLFSDIISPYLFSTAIHINDIIERKKYINSTIEYLFRNGIDYFDDLLIFYRIIFLWQIIDTQVCCNYNKDEIHELILKLIETYETKKKNTIQNIKDYNLLISLRYVSRLDENIRKLRDYKLDLLGPYFYRGMPETDNEKNDFILKFLNNISNITRIPIKNWKYLDHIDPKTKIDLIYSQLEIILGIMVELPNSINFSEV